MTETASVQAAIQTIGVPQPLVDGPEKTTGKAMFAADFNDARALVGRILRAPVAHANITAIDISKADALPGVMAVVTSADCADSYGVLPIAMNEWALANTRVRYRGEPVAAVAAVDVATAQRALDLIDVTYEELPAYFTADEARARSKFFRRLHVPLPFFCTKSSGSSGGGVANTNATSANNPLASSRYQTAARAGPIF